MLHIFAKVALQPEMRVSEETLQAMIIDLGQIEACPKPATYFTIGNWLLDEGLINQIRYALNMALCQSVLIN
jgi:hypothetical protein